MTRKDYILIAETLRSQWKDAHSKHFCRSEQYSEGMQNGVRAVTYQIADALESDNPRFDREHFLAVVRGEKELNSRPARALR